MISLYAFTYPSAVAKFKSSGYILTKVGDTKREVQVRLNEQGGSASYEIKEVVGEWKNLQRIQRDYEVHRVLTQRGLHHRDAEGTEWFKLPGATLEDARKYVDDVVTMLEGGKVRDAVKLRKLQQRALDQAMAVINAHSEPSLIANLCPRFGKTIWALALFNAVSKLYGNQVMVLPAYWLSVHNSFATEIESFSDFLDIGLVDHTKPDAAELYASYRAQGMRVVIAASLHGEVEEWKKKYQWVADIDNSEMFVFADEGDFGTHAENQVAKMAHLFSGTTGDMGKFVRVYASGTNIQRLAKCSKTINGVLFTAYSQLEATETTVVKRRFFAMPLDALKREVELNAVEVQPTWVKIWGRPNANSAFLGALAQALVGDNTLRPEMNLSSVTNDDINVFMVLCSANNAEMGQAKKIFATAVPDYSIVVLNGDETTNHNAEALAEREINLAKRAGKRGVIFLANQMGSRSFSVPEIQAVVIAYDRGSVDATMQKASRMLTPTKKDRKLYNGSDKTVGYLFDLSFDPNRAENIERLVLEEALMVQRSGETEDFVAATKYVLSNINLMKVNAYGYPVEVTEADLFTVFGDNEAMLRVADIAVDIEGALESGIFDILADVKAGGKAPANKRVVVGKNAKNSVKEGGTAPDRKPTDSDLREMNKTINEAIRTINRSVTSVYYLADCSGSSFRDALRAIADNGAFDAEYRSLFGISAKDTLRLLDERVLNEAILDVIVQNSQPKAVDNLFL